MKTEEEPLEIPAFRMGEVHGMICPGPEAMEELCGLTRIPHGAKDDLLEEFLIDRI